MKRRLTEETPVNPFEIVRRVGLTLPDVEAARRYDGSPVLKVFGNFMAGLASHPSAEPETLVVRIAVEERDELMEDAPQTYYVTDYYRSHPVVLVRLSDIDGEALRDLLSMARRLTLAKSRTGRGRQSVPRIPMTKRETMSDGLPAGLGAPAVRALTGAGFTTLRQLTKATEADLLKLHGMGPRAIGTITAALRERRLSLAKPRKMK
jgi:hypothetical protein